MGEGLGMWPGGGCDLWPGAHDFSPATAAMVAARGVPCSGHWAFIRACRPHPLPPLSLPSLSFPKSAFLRISEWGKACPIFLYLSYDIKIHCDIYRVLI